MNNKWQEKTFDGQDMRAVAKYCLHILIFLNLHPQK